jgi:hypothetical protein
MIPKRKLSVREVAVFSNMERTSRKLVYFELANGMSFSDVLEKYCDIIAFEKQIKNSRNRTKICRESFLY